MLELYSSQNSILHRTHARVKILFTLAFIVFVNLSPTSAWPAFIFFFSLLVSLILISQVGIRYLFKRSLLALPFIISAIPLIFWGPDPHLQVRIMDGVLLPVSITGFERCVSITIKAWLSVLSAILLTATTPFKEITSGFHQLHVPLVIISIIELMWRYLFVIVDEVTRMIRARNSRSSELDRSHHAGGSVFWRGQVTGYMAGSLFLRSLERSERVYEAMLSRGYTGEPLETGTGSLPRYDWWKLAVALLLLFIIFIIGIITAR